ncbi:MAG: hypothetical protein J5486_07980 [Bacteroidaceae bacterium]|nr:hypothetical protein [Bacteroidaceae bacterium]
MHVIFSNRNNGLSVASLLGSATEQVFYEPDDNAAIRRLRSEAEAYDLQAHDNQRLECLLLLQEQTTLWLLQTVGLPDDLYNKVDLTATTAVDLMAKTIFVKLPQSTAYYPSLDRNTIDRDSDQTVHLLLVGMTPLTEAMAINAALVAHYPNYCRDSRLRTRITIIDDNIFELRDHLLQRYCHLFDNSYYRTIDLTDSNPHCVLHRPMYEGSRTDFVDIEWEFVNGNLRNDAMRRKVTEWSVSPNQQLTIILCHNDDIRNYNEAFSLPEQTYKNSIPVLCHAGQNDVLSLILSNKTYSSITPFSINSCSLDTLRVLTNLGRRVNYVYNHCFSLEAGAPITAPADIDEGKLMELWQQVGSLPKQYSNIFNAMTLGTKMHSLGHNAKDWEQYYALSREEVEVLTEVEHNRWSVEELILGYRPLNDEEQQRVDADITLKRVLRNQKIHYDLRAFSDLRSDITGKNVNVYDMALVQAIPLIIKSCITS